MSIELEPSELGFRRPFNHEVTQVLRLRNPHSDPVAFKVKTTAPRQYCVRPNSGTIDARQEVDIQVLLQAMKEDPPPDAKCRDKFLVQSAPIPDPTAIGNVAQVWSDIEKAGKEGIKERKIRVVFLPANDGSGTAAEGQDAQAAKAFRSPSPANYGTPAREADPKSTYDAAKSKVANAGAAVSSSVQEQVSAAQSTVKQAKDAAAEGIRQRKPDSTTVDRVTGATGMQQETSQGVPMQLVAALCLLSFLIAYFFF